MSDRRDRLQGRPALGVPVVRPAHAFQKERRQVKATSKPARPARAAKATAQTVHAKEVEA